MSPAECERLKAEAVDVARKRLAAGYDPLLVARFVWSHYGYACHVIDGRLNFALAGRGEFASIKV